MKIKSLAKILIVLVFLTSWFLSGWTQIFNNKEIPFTPSKVEALTQIVRPDGDTATLDWNTTDGDGGGAHSTEVDEVVTQPDAGTTTDYLDNNGSLSNNDQLQMGTIAGITQVTAINVWIYGYATKINSPMSVDLYYNGAIQHTSVVNMRQGYSWYNTNFTGLALSQSDLDGLEIFLSGDKEQRTFYVATLYADITHSAISITLSTDGTVAFGMLELGTTQNSTGISDVQTVSVDSGPADLDVKSSNFTEGGNTWILNTTNGDNQVKWESSKDGSAWTTFALIDTLYSLDVNVPQGETRDLHLQITMPTLSDSNGTYSSTVIIVASAP